MHLRGRIHTMLASGRKAKDSPPRSADRLAKLIPVSCITSPIRNCPGSPLPPELPPGCQRSESAGAWMKFGWQVTTIIRCPLFFGQLACIGGAGIVRLTTGVKKILTIYQRYDIFNRQSAAGRHEPRACCGPYSPGQRNVTMATGLPWFLWRLTNRRDLHACSGQIWIWPSPA